MKKNVLLIIQNLQNGGAEHAITILAESLKEDYNVCLVVFDGKEKEFNTNVEVIDLKLPEKDTILGKIFVLFRRIRKLKQLKRDFNIEYTISYLNGPNIVNVLSKGNDKKIISVRNIQSKLKRNFYREYANKISLKKADKIVVVSEDVKNDIINHYRFDNSKIIKIYNMLNIEEIKQKQKEPIEEKEIFNNNGIKIINIGRLVLQKGQWHLIKSFKIVHEQIPDAKLIIIGKGELREDLMKLIDELGLNNYVFILDFKMNPYKYLYNSDIYVSTSMYEGMSNVILESMICELPIIAANCLGGMNEIFDNKYGIVIPVLSDNYDITNKITQEDYNLAKTIIETINSKEQMKKYREMSKTRALDFDKEIIKKQWINLIEEI